MRNHYFTRSELVAFTAPKHVQEQMFAKCSAQHGDEEAVLADATEKTKAIREGHREALERIAALLFKRGRLPGTRSAKLSVT